MEERLSSILARVFLALSVLVFLFLATTASAQTPPGAMTISGEVSVVIFDDFETDRSEIRYYVIDETTGRETELFFTGVVPQSVTTGNRVRIEGQVTPAGMNVNDLVLLQTGPPVSTTAEAGPPAPETRKILTLLVDFNDATVDGPGMDNGVTLQEAKDTMYNDPRSVAGLYFNASLGTFTLDPDGDGDVELDVFGPYQINDSYIGGIEAQCTPSTWVNLASAAWEAANPGKDISIYRHRLLIVPNYWDWSNRHCGWGGVAQLGCGTWCWALSADPDVIQFGTIIHELGHNFGFNHARTDPGNDGFDGNIDSEYGDTSDLMGSSRSWMKFNAPHAEDKDWISPDYELRDVTPAASPQQFSLIAMDEEVWDMPGLRALKIQRSGNSSYFVSYRSNSGDYSDVNFEYANRINIHYGFNNNTYSYFIRTLEPGESFVDENADLRITANNGSMVTISRNTEQTCYSLSLGHSGSGSDPVADPAHSDECEPGNYQAGELISLSAMPDAGWVVESWTGTDDDGSTSTANLLTMPANAAAVAVNYGQLPPACFPLARTHGGSGADPVAIPTKSAGCINGSYLAGENILLVAAPDPDWEVVGWSGSDDDSSTQNNNRLTMPANATLVSVFYEKSLPSCFSLQVSHGGSGADPVVSPAGSEGCDSGSYVEGELITLAAMPAPGWRVDNWQGTDDDSSQSQDNHLTMPAGPVAVRVNYVFGPEPGNGETFFVPLEPCRLADSRVVGGPFSAESARDFRAWGDGLAEQGGTDDCGVPASAVAVHLNFTVVNPAGFGYLRAWPFGEEEPLATLMAFTGGPGISNASALAICNTCPSDFHVKVYGSGTDLVIEVVGYYQYVSPAIPASREQESD
jgi:hypothetical protein